MGPPLYPVRHMDHRQSSCLQVFVGVLLALTDCAPTRDAGPYEPCEPTTRPCDTSLTCQPPTVQATTGTPGSLCTATCRTDADCPLPPTQGVARVCVLPPGSSMGTCLAYCETDVDCLPGTFCRTASQADHGQVRVCVP